jgi:predicted nucleotidyltransferase
LPATPAPSRFRTGVNSRTFASNFLHWRHTGHRFLIGGIPTDVVPFGDIEAPPGMSSQPPGKEALNVHGVTDVYQQADKLSNM